jgi:endonuclease/exonuclease/phosphatase family metal-dependent hydrolase
MTYNVHSCVGADRRCDVGRIAAVIAHEKPDIVALQELDAGRQRTGKVDQAHQIATRLGMAFYFHPTIQVAEERYDAILTALPMEEVHSAALPTLKGVRGLEPRGAIWAKIGAGGKRLNVINTHLGLVPLEQRDQTACLLGKDWLDHPDATDPLLMLGDFNATSRYACYGRLTGRLRDAQRVLQQQRGRSGRAIPTFPSRFPVLRIDHVFVSKGIKVLDVRVPDGPLARAASDHLPLVADIEI